MQTQSDVKPLQASRFNQFDVRESVQPATTTGASYVNKIQNRLKNNQNNGQQMMSSKISMLKQNSFKQDIQNCQIKCQTKTIRQQSLTSTNQSSIKFQSQNQFFKRDVNLTQKGQQRMQQQHQNVQATNSQSKRLQNKVQSMVRTRMEFSSDNQNENNNNNNCSTNYFISDSTTLSSAQPKKPQKWRQKSQDIRMHACSPKRQSECLRDLTLYVNTMSALNNTSCQAASKQRINIHKFLEESSKKHIQSKQAMRFLKENHFDQYSEYLMQKKNDLNSNVQKGMDVSSKRRAQSSLSIQTTNATTPSYKEKQKHSLQKSHQHQCYPQTTQGDRVKIQWISTNNDDDSNAIKMQTMNQIQSTQIVKQQLNNNNNLNANAKRLCDVRKNLFPGKSVLTQQVEQEEPSYITQELIKQQSEVDPQIQIEQLMSVIKRTALVLSAYQKKQTKLEQENRQLQCSMLKLKDQMYQLKSSQNGMNYKQNK